VKNGNGNYDYRWTMLNDFGNTATINSYTDAEPTITAAAPPYVFYYLVTVTEKGKEIPQVANKVVKIQLLTSGYMLAMKDAPMDMYNEINDMHIVNKR